MKAKHYSLLLLSALALFGLSGCSQPVTNLTAPQIPQNPSGIYTLSCHTQVDDDHVVKGSEQAFVTIEGTERQMAPSPAGGDLYEYEYTMPSDRSQAKYYYSVKYNVERDGITRQRVATSKLYTLNIVNRYVITMEATRGPVGATIPVVGRGFTKFDTVVIGGLEAPTSYASPNAISFQIPPMPGDHDYAVELHSGTNVYPMGLFHLDTTNLSVTPESLDFNSGDNAKLVISMGRPAPQGGVPVSVLTDVPSSVIMAPVTIPGGASTVSVTIKGGSPGKGTLHLNAPGFNGVIVPVSVIPATAPEPIVPVFTPPPPPPPAPAPVHMGS
jgi:hypothetical protein